MSQTSELLSSSDLGCFSPFVCAPLGLRLLRSVVCDRQIHCVHYLPVVLFMSVLEQHIAIFKMAG